MKKIFSLILIMTAIVLPSFADDANEDSSSENISLAPSEIYESSEGRHRSAMRININAYYNAMSRTIDIYYIGEATYSGTYPFTFEGNSLA